MAYQPADNYEYLQKDASPLLPSSEDSNATITDDPKALRTSSDLVNGLLIDFLLMLVSIAILVFAVLGYRAGHSVMGPREDGFLDTARIVRVYYFPTSVGPANNSCQLATFFPYLFAFGFGRTLQNFLSWRLEKGIDCLSFAYLSRSLSLGSAYTAPLRVRHAHWIPPLLFVSWAFSPLGSQASLRFISKQRETVFTQLPGAIKYVYPAATFQSACASCSIARYNSIFLSSFLSTSNTGHTPQDSWGNVRIPLLDDQNSSDNTNAWRDVSPQTNPQYSSLIGIPLTIPHGPGNMTFIMQSWYWQLENSTLWKNGSTGSLLTGRSEYNGSSVLTNFTGLNVQWQFAVPRNLNPEAASIPITFEVTTNSAFLENSPNFTYTYVSGGSEISKYSRDVAMRLDGVLTQRPVELNVTCAGLSCNVIAVRNVVMDPGYASSNDTHYLSVFMLGHLARAFPNEHPGTPQPGVLEAYLYDPTQNPYSVLRYTDIQTLGLTWIDSETMARRLSQVMNTFWMADNYVNNVASGFNTSDPFLVKASAVKSSNVTAASDQDFLECDVGWMAVFCISALVMLLAAIVSASISFVRLAPDFTDFLSALVLNDGSLTLVGFSHLGEYERVERLKGIKLKVGDREAGKRVGKVVIAEEAEVGNLEKGRLYL